MRVPPHRRADTTKAFEAFLCQAWPHDFRTHPPPEGTLLECVVIEPRAHPLLMPVLRNVSSTLPNAALTIVGSSDNVAVVSEAIGAGTNVRFIDCGSPSLSYKAYSALLCNPQLWQRLGGEHILIIQTDAGLRHNAILRFLEFDFVGAPWNHVVARDPRVRVGNGGLSLRRRAKMLEVLRKHAPDHARFETLPEHGEPEDVFFARCLVDDPTAVLPSPEVANAFSVEATWDASDPMGFHQPHLFWDGPALQELLVGAPATITGCEVDEGWLESPDGVRTDPGLVRWLRLGISASGLHIPSGTLVPAHDQETTLAFKLNSRVHRIPLENGRTLESWTL